MQFSAYAVIALIMRENTSLDIETLMETDSPELLNEVEVRI